MEQSLAYRAGYEIGRAKRELEQVKAQRKKVGVSGAGGTPKAWDLLRAIGGFPTRLSNFHVGLMITLALSIDLSQFGLDFVVLVGEILNPLIDLFAILLFWFWFAIKGFSVFSGKNITRKWATTAVSVIIELIPLINDLPAWTFYVVRMNMIARIEDFEEYGLSLAKKEASLVAEIAQLERVVGESEDEDRRASDEATMTAQNNTVKENAEAEERGQLIEGRFGDGKDTSPDPNRLGQKPMLDIKPPLKNAA